MAACRYRRTAYSPCRLTVATRHVIANTTGDPLHGHLRTNRPGGADRFGRRWSCRNQGEPRWTAGDRRCPLVHPPSRRRDWIGAGVARLGRVRQSDEDQNRSGG